eukprot:TRINITY_DN22804_c0_g1_i1.p1 TRINITY_DN22804_c0_g1~~TRINITY_DN22804_c0_g1_i1.p1  ORF type:complete len:460 (+),score=66.89 TRINITY_DN22804_c0_g1_i1:59-1381(+)
MPVRVNGGNAESKLPSMSTVEYWDEMYTDRTTSYDTLYAYEDIRSFMLSFMNTEGLGTASTSCAESITGRCQRSREGIRILHIGCGTSDVVDGLWREGFRSIVNIDFSKVVVDLMAKRWDERASRKKVEAEGSEMRRQVRWLCMDLTDLSAFGGGSFDLLIEKFTFDSILCEAKDDSVDRKGWAAVKECHRVLAPGGILLSFAWGEKTRVKLLQCGGLFSVTSSRLTGDAQQRPMVYVCRKCTPCTDFRAVRAHVGNGRFEHHQDPVVVEATRRSACDRTDKSACVLVPSSAADPQAPASMSTTAASSSTASRGCGEPCSPREAVPTDVSAVLGLTTFEETLSVRFRDTAEIWIIFAGVVDIKSVDIDIDVCQHEVRWRFRSASLADGAWSHAKFAGKVYEAAAEARLTSKVPLRVSSLSAVSSCVKDKRCALRITAPLA